CVLLSSSVLVCVRPPRRGPPGPGALRPTGEAVGRAKRSADRSSGPGEAVGGRSGWAVGVMSVEHREQVVLAHDQVLLAVDLDLGAAVLAEQHAVAGLDLGRDDLAVLVALARADGDHLGLDRLLLGRIGDEQTTRGLGLL